MSVYFIADTHFGDEHIFRYENRPFDSVDEMNAAIIANWNSTVSPEDTVWHTGDFAVHGCEEKILKQLNGHIRLVRGNHDQQPNGYYRDCGFEEVYDYPILLDNFWILSHEPIYVNVNMPYANIFGHVHANPMYKDFSSHHFCISAERIAYKPISFETIKAIVSK